MSTRIQQYLPTEIPAEPGVGASDLANNGNGRLNLPHNTASLITKMESNTEPDKSTQLDVEAKLCAPVPMPIIVEDGHRLRLNPSIAVVLGLKRTLVPVESSLFAKWAINGTSDDALKDALGQRIESEPTSVQIRAACQAGVESANEIAQLAATTKTKLSRLLDRSDPYMKHPVDSNERLNLWQKCIIGFGVLLGLAASITTTYFSIWAAFWIVKNSGFFSEQDGKAALAISFIWAVAPMGFLKVLISTCQNDRDRLRFYNWSAVVGGLLLVVGITAFASTFGPATFRPPFDPGTWTPTASPVGATRATVLLICAMSLEGLLAALVFQRFVLKPLELQYEMVSNPEWLKVKDELDQAIEREADSNAIRTYLQQRARALDAECKLFIETGIQSVAALRKEVEATQTRSREEVLSKFLNNQKD